MTNRENLRQRLEALGWSQQRLAEWLSEVTGDDINLRRVQRWLSTHESACPGWPIVLLDNLQS